MIWGESIATIEVITYSVAYRNFNLYVPWELTPAIRIVFGSGDSVCFFQFVATASACICVCTPVHCMCAHPYLYEYGYRYARAWYGYEV